MLRISDRTRAIGDQCRTRSGTVWIYPPGVNNMCTPNVITHANAMLENGCHVTLPPVSAKNGGAWRKLQTHAKRSAKHGRNGIKWCSPAPAFPPSQHAAAMPTSVAAAYTATALIW